MNPLHANGLVSFASGQLPASGELPSEINVAPWGTHYTAKGTIIVNETTAQQLPANQQASNFDRIALDFNHNTVPGSESYQGEPAKVAAHGIPQIIPERGIVLSALSWTPAGRSAIENGDYIDLSPTLQLNSQGEAVFIHSAALCRQGAIPGLSLFSAASFLKPEQQVSLYADASFNPLQGRSWELLCQCLGLDPAKATEEQAEEAALKLAGVDASDPWAVLDLKAGQPEAPTKPFAAQIYGLAVETLSANGQLRPDSLETLAAVSAAGERLFFAAALRPLGLAPADFRQHPLSAPASEELRLFSLMGLSVAEVVRMQAREVVRALPEPEEAAVLRAVGFSAERIDRLKLLGAKAALSAPESPDEEQEIYRLCGVTAGQVKKRFPST